jgi:hypothetical protein
MAMKGAEKETIAILKQRSPSRLGSNDRTCFAAALQQFGQADLKSAPMHPRQN